MLDAYGRVVQLVRTPACHAGGREFEPHPGRQQCASIAQLVEQWTENPRVTGSIPVRGTILGVLSNLYILCGGIPERPMGTDCKSAGNAFGGSNPPPPTRKDDCFAIVFFYRRVPLRLIKSRASPYDFDRFELLPRCDLRNTYLTIHSSPPSNMYPKDSAIFREGIFST